MAHIEEKEELTRARGTCKAQVTGFSKILDKFEAKSELTDLDLIEIEERLFKINLIGEKFDTIQENLEFILDLAELEKENAERVKFDESYFNATARAKYLIKMCHAKNAVITQVEEESIFSDTAKATGVGNIANLVKLPIIPLPKFHGDYDKWLEFREIFGSLIHDNAALNDIQKFHYLRASLEDDASEVVRSFDFCRENYDIAWNALCDRYNNTRLLVHRHVKSLFALQSIENESARELRRVIDLVSKSLNSLAQLNEPTEHWDTLIIYLISTKLDPVSARGWEQFKCTNNTPSWGEFKDFLKGRADLLETLEQREKVQRHDIRDKHQQNDQRKGSHRGNGMHDSRGLFSSNVRCAFCKRDHNIINCEDFLGLPINQRIEKARSLRLCLNCLKFGHLGRLCRGNPCAKCKGKHNALLHLEYDKGEKVVNNKSVEKLDRDAEGQSVTLSSSGVNNHVLLSTARVEVMDKNGKYHTARAILDSGSQSSFITLNLCNNLNIAKENINIFVGGLGQIATEIKYKCKIKIRSLHNAFETDLNCLVLSEITGLVPNIRRLNAKNIEIPKNIRLSDPSYFKPEKIDILVGADLFYRLLCIGQISLNNEGAILQKTRFGWIVSGPIPAYVTSKMICNFSTNMQPQFDMQKFWEIENDFSTSVKEWSKEEVDCEAYFQKTTRRDENGRFIVSLPLNESVEKLGETERSARGRFLSLERRFESNGELKQKYIEFMSEYQAMGHMSEVSITNNDKNVYYMPHHGVIRDDSLTTKLRVVFNASAPSTTGTSLNDLQMVGPVLQKDLISHLLNFRKHRYVVSADIAKMYRQVMIEPCQRKLQRIIWRENISEPLKIFELNTITYGHAAASFLAIRCLFQLAQDCEENQPDISELIKNSFYVDDFLYGEDTIERAANGCEGVFKVLESGGFPLRKWFSNEPKILQNFAKSDDKFNIVGIDYMGPLTIKDRKGRGAKFSKCYVSVFVCFATKATHLELVTELTSQAFIRVFRRFVSRRGYPSHEYCDNGLNFIGANRELKELGEFLRDSNDLLIKSYAHENVQFHHIPAYSPHFGGLWEAGVKSSKLHLKRVAGSANLHFEELYTLLTQIESILNSRPLFHLSSDPSDMVPLTPAHFLVGKTLTELPDPDLKHIPESRLSRYQRIQQIKQHFWTRWNKEYVSELQQRVKWKSTQSQLQEGTMVLIKEDNTPSLQWRMGRVIAVHTGKDNVNRVASVKTANGIIKRAFTKLCPLPVNDFEDVLQGGGHV